MVGSPREDVFPSFLLLCGCLLIGVLDEGGGSLALMAADEEDTIARAFTSTSASFFLASEGDSLALLAGLMGEKSSGRLPSDRRGMDVCSVESEASPLLSLALIADGIDST